MSEEIVMPNRVASTKCYTPLEIKLNDKERFELAKGLNEKQQEISTAKLELKEQTKEAKEDIHRMEAQFLEDVRAVNQGIRVIPKAYCELTWTPEKNEVTYAYEGKVVKRRPPEKEDEHLFAVMFPEQEPPRNI